MYHQTQPMCLKVCTLSRTAGFTLPLNVSMFSVKYLRRLKAGLSVAITSTDQIIDIVLIQYIQYRVVSLTFVYYLGEKITIYLAKAVMFTTLMF